MDLFLAAAHAAIKRRHAAQSVRRARTSLPKLAPGEAKQGRYRGTVERREGTQRISDAEFLEYLEVRSDAWDRDVILGLLVLWWLKCIVMNLG